MSSSLRRVNYALDRLAEKLFTENDLGEFEWLDEVAEHTGMDRTHLYNIFYGGEAITLQDYCILSDFAGIDPINVPEPYMLRVRTKAE